MPVPESGSGAEAGSIPRDEAAEQLLAVYMDLYKHQFELFYKGFLMYLVAVGAIAALLFRAGGAGEAVGYLGEVITLFSACALVISLVVCIGFHQLSEIIRPLERRLGVKAFPFWGIQCTSVALAAVAMIIGVSGWRIETGFLVTPGG